MLPLLLPCRRCCRLLLLELCLLPAPPPWLPLLPPPAASLLPSFAAALLRLLLDAWLLPLLSTSHAQRLPPAWHLLPPSQLLLLLLLIAKGCTNPAIVRTGCTTVAAVLLPGHLASGASHMPPRVWLPLLLLPFVPCFCFFLVGLPCSLVAAAAGLRGAADSLGSARGVLAIHRGSTAATAVPLLC